MSMFGSLLFVTCLIGLASAQTIDNCPTVVPRDQHTVVFGYQCFQFVLNKEMDYTDAQKDCQSLGGTLALTKTKAVQQFIQTTAQSLGVHSALWIGLNDKAKEDTFVWEDGTTLDASISNWGEDEGPGTKFFLRFSSKNCVATNIAKNGVWEDHECHDAFFGLFKYEKHYICSYDMIPL